MNREQLKSKILREVVVLYFDHLLANEDMLNSDLYHSFFHTWHKKLLHGDLDELTIEDLKTLQKDLDNIYSIYYPSPSSGQKLSIHDLNHSLNKYISLQECVN